MINQVSYNKHLVASLGHLSHKKDILKDDGDDHDVWIDLLESILGDKK